MSAGRIIQSPFFSPKIHRRREKASALELGKKMSLEMTEETDQKILKAMPGKLHETTSSGWSANYYRST
ncbi:hypothetical protein HID58_046563 [Brassica napus]|uniref:Uncharacterized protein n=1 Tax=Brassica napus TaxID=3708 RepID=A0ABQ8AYA6_BRANA|nr:hypothetical protein HID58_046563 [Brassica napus]